MALLLEFLLRGRSMFAPSSHGGKPMSLLGWGSIGSLRASALEGLFSTWVMIHGCGLWSSPPLRLPTCILDPNPTESCVWTQVWTPAGGIVLGSYVTGGEVRRGWEGWIFRGESLRSRIWLYFPFCFLLPSTSAHTSNASEPFYLVCPTVMD